MHKQRWLIILIWQICFSDHLSLWFVQVQVRTWLDWTGPGPELDNLSHDIHEPYLFISVWLDSCIKELIAKNDTIVRNVLDIEACINKFTSEFRKRLNVLSLRWHCAVSLKRTCYFQINISKANKASQFPQFRLLFTRTKMDSRLVLLLIIGSVMAFEIEVAQNEDIFDR